MVIAKFNQLMRNHPSANLKLSIRAVDGCKVVASVRFEVGGLEYGENLINPETDDQLGVLIEIAERSIEAITNKQGGEAC